MSNRTNGAGETKYDISNIDIRNFDMRTVARCYTSLPTRLLDLTPDRVTAVIPVMESYCNPSGSMQGGFISAAFDNVFGPLCVAATSAAKITTLYINTVFHRPIFPHDEFIIVAALKSKGRTMVYMTAEGYNRENQLIASASAQYMILDAI